jgi:hypothetical protein
VSAYPVTISKLDEPICWLSATVNHDVARRWALANLGRDVTVGPICEHDGDALEVPREPSPDDRNREHALSLIARTRREAFAEAYEVVHGVINGWCQWVDALNELERRASL